MKPLLFDAICPTHKLPRFWRAAQQASPSFILIVCFFPPRLFLLDKRQLLDPWLHVILSRTSGTGARGACRWVVPVEFPGAFLLGLPSCLAVVILLFVDELGLLAAV